MRVTGSVTFIVIQAGSTKQLETNWVTHSYLTEGVAVSLGSNEDVVPPTQCVWRLEWGYVRGCLNTSSSGNWAYMVAFKLRCMLGTAGTSSLTEKCAESLPRMS